MKKNVKKNRMLHLLCKEDVVNDLFVLDETLILLDDLPSRSSLFNPTKQEDEAIYRAFQRLLQIVDLFHLDALHPEVLQQ